MMKQSYVLLLLIFLSACGSTPQKLAPIENKTADWSINRVVQSNHSMITLLDPTDLAHHQAEPANWYLYDFAIKDDLQTGRFAAVLTERSGKFDVRITAGELTAEEQAVKGPVAKMRLRVINHRLLLSGGETWPSVETDYRRYAHDQRWISLANGDYGVIISALNPAANQADYVFQLIKVSDMASVKHAPGVPQLIYGQKATVVGVNSKGFYFNERCDNVPSSASWAPLSSRTMPIPGARQNLELPRSMHTWAIGQQQAGKNVAIPIVLARNPEVGSFGFYIKPTTWNQQQVKNSNVAEVNALVRCAVRITGVVPNPSDFQLQLSAMPTASDRITGAKKQELMDGFTTWMRNTNDLAWRFKAAKVRRSDTDAAMLLGILGYLNLSSKESETLLPMSNALRVDYLLDRLSNP